LILVIILINLEGGIGTFFNIAATDHKLHTIQWNWDKQSYMTTAFWVVFFGALGQNLVSYTSDHAVVQRYLTTRDEKAAAKAIWANGIMSLFAGLLFFTLGAALFVFYKTYPSHLDPVFRTDAIMPLFIVQEIPVGLAGLIVAGIFAAAQSTISTSMNSTATAIVTDFFRRFRLAASEKSYLNLARLMTILLGSAGTAFALLFVQSDVKSLFDSFISIIGLFGGSLAGLFLLGMFTLRAHGTGAVTGAIAGAVVLYLVKMHTQTHIFLYALVGISTCMIVGYLVSLIFPGKSRPVDGLTIYTLKRRRV
jgi:Na+/proline symporter